MTLAWQSGATPVVVLTKADLVEDYEDYVASIGVVAPGVEVHLVSSKTGYGMENLKKYLQPGDDDTMRRALEVVILDRKASTSYIQRRLKIGYNRAAELIDTMEERGIVGPPSGSGNKREILIFDGLEINE